MRSILTTALAITVLSIGAVGLQAKESSIQQKANSYRLHDPAVRSHIFSDRYAGMVYINRAEPKCTVFGSYVGPCAR